MAQSELRPVVLHVVDRTTGGVPVAARTYIRNTADDVRHIVVTPGGVAAPWADSSAEVVDLGRGFLRRIKRVRELVLAHRPAAVHAHSSFSGVYARLAVRAGRDARIVYSPHCFAFERTDLGVAKRGIIRRIERLLTWNTSVIAACGTAESVLAKELAPSRIEVAVIPNVASIDVVRKVPESVTQLRICMSGRICAQKAPAFFRETLTRLREQHVWVAPTWIGDGDQADQVTLQAAGVRVTGWMTAEELSRVLGENDLYLHTAAWEGFPIAVIDAHAVGLPILVRKISAFGDVPDELTIESGLNAMTAALRDGGFEEWARCNVMLWAGYLRDNHPEGQRKALLAIWSGGA